MRYKFTLCIVLVFILFQMSDSQSDNIESSIPQNLQKEFNCNNGNDCKNILYYANVHVTYNRVRVGSKVSVIAESDKKSLIVDENRNFISVLTEVLKKTGAPSKSKPLKVNSASINISPTPSKTDQLESPSSIQSSERAQFTQEVESSVDNSGPGQEEDNDNEEEEGAIEDIHSSKVPSKTKDPSHFQPSVNEQVTTTSSTQSNEEPINIDIVASSTQSNLSSDAVGNETSIKSDVSSNVTQSNKTSDPLNNETSARTSDLDSEMLTKGESKFSTFKSTITNSSQNQSFDAVAHEPSSETNKSNTQMQTEVSKRSDSETTKILAEGDTPGNKTDIKMNPVNISNYETLAGTNGSESKTQTKEMTEGSKLSDPVVGIGGILAGANISEKEKHEVSHLQSKEIESSENTTKSNQTSDPVSSGPSAGTNNSENITQTEKKTESSTVVPKTDDLLNNNTHTDETSDSIIKEPSKEAEILDRKKQANDQKESPPVYKEMYASEKYPFNGTLVSGYLIKANSPDNKIQNEEKSHELVTETDPSVHDTSQQISDGQVPGVDSTNEKTSPVENSTSLDPVTPNKNVSVGDAKNHHELNSMTNAIETKNYSSEEKSQIDKSKETTYGHTLNSNKILNYDKIKNTLRYSHQVGIQKRYGADQPTMANIITDNLVAKNRKKEEPIIDDAINSNNENSRLQNKNGDKPVGRIEMMKGSRESKTEFSADNFPVMEETWEDFVNENLGFLSNFISIQEIASSPFSKYPSFIVILNSVLFLVFLFMINCFSVRKCDSIIKGKLYMCEKKLLEHNVEKVQTQELIEEKRETKSLLDKLRDENNLQKNKIDILTCKISELEKHESSLTENLNEYKSKYETLEEMSNKKNIKKNYEKLMDEVNVQKDKLDQLAARMEERAETLRNEKENIESLLKVQAEEHNKIVNDYRILLNNVELENKELREIVQTLSVESDVGEKLLEAVKLQVQLSDLEKENQNLMHQLEGEREAHKLLEDHQRMTQKEVNDLRESYEIVLKDKTDVTNKLKYITDYFQQLEDKLKKEIADKDDLLNEKLGDDDSLAKALMNLRKENCVLNEENNILRSKYDSLKVELTDQKNEEKLSKTKLESEREQIWMDWRAAERKIESLNLDNKVLRSKLVAMGSKSETSFREMHTQTYDDPDKMLSPTSSLFLDHASPVPQPAFFIPSYAIPPPPLSDDEMRQLYGANRNYNENGYHSDENHEHSYDHRLPPLGGTFSPPTLDNIPVPNIPPPLDNDQLWRRQTWNSQDISSNDEEPNIAHNAYSRRRTGDSVSSVSSKRSFV